jgi:prepilin-type N-terminal cleavage/methylation domain-containing protein
MKGERVHRRSSGGFSLVEVLIVTAILTLLAGIIFTASGPARRMAQVASCASNLRQIGMAYSMYLSDYGQYPDFHVLVQDAAPIYLKDRHVLYCPANTEGPLENLTSSYYPHVYAPPDGVSFSTLHTVDPDFVLVWCQAHVRPKEISPVGGRTGARRVSSDYPFYPVLRADGHVERVPTDRVRYFPLKGKNFEGNAFLKVFPGESWYDRALTPDTPGVPAL